MTQTHEQTGEYDDLVKELRILDSFNSWGTCERGARAIEALQRRVGELEAERDELKLQADFSYEEDQAGNRAFDKLQDETISLTQERDEARAALEKIREITLSESLTATASVNSILIITNAALSPEPEEDGS